MPPQKKKLNAAIYRKRYDSLKPSQKVTRIKALEALRQARKTGRALSSISKEIGISTRTAVKHTGAFKKVKGRWKPAKTDKISRPPMAMNENAQEVTVKTRSSKYAIMIGEYQNAVKEFLETANSAALKTFDGKFITDIEGVKHFFETDPDAVIAIHERREDYEFYEVYRP